VPAAGQNMADTKVSTIQAMAARDSQTNMVQAVVWLSVIVWKGKNSKNQTL
jgi:hypothetical protein